MVKKNDILNLLNKFKIWHILINYKYVIITEVVSNSFDPFPPDRIFYFKTLYGVYKYLDNIYLNCKKHITVFEDISYVKTLIAEYDNEYFEIDFYIKILEERDIPNLLFNTIDCISTGSIVFKVIDDGLEVVESKLNYWNKFICDDPKILEHLITVQDKFYGYEYEDDILKSNGIYSIDKELDCDLYNIFDVTCKFNMEAILSALINKTSLISEEVLIECIDYKYFGYYIVNVDNFVLVVW